MKLLIFFVSVLIVGSTFGQGFAPLNTNNPKRFVNPNNLDDNDYFFYSTQTVVSGDTTTFNQYLRKSSYHVDVTGTDCELWGGSIQPTADTTWLGRQLRYNSATQQLICNNSTMDELVFDFGMNLGDSSIYYANGASNYFMRFDNLIQELVLDSLEWVKSFTIWKYDGSGNLIQSPLNGFEIKLSENLGLVNLIDCFQFPTIEKGLTLMGQLNTTLGYYQMTYDEAFPWNLGDTIELRGVNNPQSWTGSMTTSYKLITIQNRIETIDSVWIYLNIDEQLVQTPNGSPWGYPSTYNIGYTNPIVYRKKENISAFPNNATYDGVNYINDSVNFCGMRGRHKSYGEFMVYCDSCDCFTYYDGHGSGVSEYEYLEGLGMTFSSGQGYGDWTSILEAELIFSNVGGVQCGTLIPLSIDTLTLDNETELVKIVDLLGRETEFKPNTVLIYIYSDGTMEKIYKAEL